MQSTLKLQETRVSLPSSDSDEDVVTEYPDSLDCKCCSLRKEVALLEDLPDAVLIVLEEACASMNKGLVNWIFKHKSMRILSVFTLPYVLSLDIAYVICVKLIQLLPKLKQDALALVERLIAKLIHVITNFNKHRHIYSAKFTCQLALTEYDYEVSNCPSIKAKTVPHRPSCVSSSLPQLDASVERVLGSVNLDFTVDMAARCSKSIPIDTAGQLGSTVHADAKERTAVDIANAAFEWETHNPEDWNTHEDTFEQILEVTQKQEALISYYYLDGKNSEMKVTEIFNVTDADTSALLPAEEREINHNLCWDEDWQTIENPNDTRALPPSSSEATLESQVDSELDCSFDMVNLMSSDEFKGDVFTNGCHPLNGVWVHPSQRNGMSVSMDK